jgi:hypothetical protein
VPDVRGQSLADASRILANSHFKMVRLDAEDQLTCPSSEPFETVGFYGPHRATQGSTITVCVSKGTLQHLVIPRPIIRKPAPRTTGRTGAASKKPTPAPATKSKPGHRRP